MLRRLTLALALLLLGCATTSTNSDTDTLPTFDATKPIERAIHSTVLMQSPEGRTFCSGTIVKREKLILTAGHCVDDGADFVLVGLHGRYRATVVFLDRVNDIALLRPPAGLLRGKDGVPLASSPARMGDHIFALGHAKGDDFPFSLTDGIVSFPHRTDPQHYVQSTAPLLGGMSGGGTYNDRGELLGANLFVWLEPLHCQMSCSGVYQDSPLYGFSYLPLIQIAIESVN